MNFFTQLSSLLTFSLFLSSELSKTMVAAAKPNILFYLTDDQGVGDIFNPVIATPNLSKFAREGMVLNFTIAHSLCAPSRWALLTGSNEVLHNQLDGKIPVPEVTLPKELQQQGYKTAIIGKYGFGGANTISSAYAMGFNYSYIYPTHVDAHVTFPAWLEENGKRITFPNNRNANKQLCTRQDQSCSYGPDLFLNKGLKYLEDNVNNTFFLFLTPNLPHVGLYNVKQRVMVSPVPQYGQYGTQRWSWAPSPYDKGTWTWDQRGYAAMITYYIDRDIGALTDKLDALGIADKTIFLFASDNGADVFFNVIKRFNANGNLRGAKGSMYEGGVRVPGIVRWTSHIKPGTVSNYPWHLQDLLPTFTTLAGKTVTKPNLVSVDKIWLHGDAAATDLDNDFISLALCKGNVEPCQRARYDLRAWPNKTLKVVANINRPPELYELISDPYESTNIAKDPVNAQYMQEYAASTKRRLTLSN